MKQILPLGLGGVAWLLLATIGFGQGLLIATNTQERITLPRPNVQPTQGGYKIKELGVQARLIDQVAQVQVSQTFVNTGSRQMEVSFVFPLPYDGAIDRLTFLVDGKEYPAKLLAAEEARRIYEGHVRHNRDPALLEWIGTGMFQTSVFPVPPGAERKVTLRYSQLLRKDRNLTDFLFPMSTAKYSSKPVEKVDIRVSVESGIKLKTIYSPTHEIGIKRPSSTNAVISYTAENTIPSGDFRLFFGVTKEKLGASVLTYRPDETDDGYLLLLASPQIEAADKKPTPKTVVCVCDRSGSMSGKKIEQAREALKFVIENLNEDDLFNIIAYDNQVEAFEPELQRYHDENRRKALGFVEGLYAGGSTNISGALTTTFKMLKDSSRPNYVIFLTDGLPTVGETAEPKIVESVEAVNGVRARLMSFGVGYDVNSRLLDRLSRTNHGQSLFVRPDENIEEHVGRLSRRISSPVMTDVKVAFDFDQIRVEEGPPVNRTYPKELHDLFEGEQLVVVARYKKSGLAKVTIQGRIDQKDQQYDFPATLEKKSSDHSYAFVEKLWAMRRIGQIIDEIDLNGKNDELIKELVTLSTRHGILTPYTSFLADENAAVGDLARAGVNVHKAGELLDRLSEVEGVAAFSQREAKKQLLEAERSMPTEEALADHATTPGLVIRDIDRDKNVRVDAVKVVGTKTLYRRGNVWYAFDAVRQKLEKADTEVKTIERFSDAYFQLVREASPAARRVLAAQAEGEELMLDAMAAPHGMGSMSEDAAEASPSMLYRVK